MKFQGKIDYIYPTKEVGEKNFKVRNIGFDTSVEVNGMNYENHVGGQLVGNKVTLADEFNVGDEVEFDFELRGQLTDKDGEPITYTNVNVYGMRLIKAAPSKTQAAQEQPTATEAQPQSQAADQPLTKDDLPF